MMDRLKFIGINSILIAVCLFLAGCGLFESKRFTELDPADTGIDFSNDLRQTTDLNIFNYLYFYDGGGVAAGDLNGDELPDLFFTSNQNRNRLYLNKGNLHFEDVTDQAMGETQNDWTTGVSFADVNADGKLDIYVCNLGSYLKVTGENKLYINQGNNENGIPTFEEQGKQYGLDLVGFSTQAAFFDYDIDGDLDMYMLNHSVHSNGTFNNASIRENYHPLAGDRLMRNDNGHFVDVTDSAGIYNSALGYGLGIGISDFNQDGYPDIYVGNDFHEDDYLYLNNGDGTFTESLEKMIKHTSRSSMGNDLVDINNDGRTDIFSIDMLPKDYEMLKASAAEDPLKIFSSKLKYGYKYQFSRNTLQLNRGNNRFSEIGLLADVYATGWSWAGLGADFDNNGFIDLFVSNGIKGRTNDLDYIKFISNDNIQYRLSGEITEEELKLTERMPPEKVHNFMFSNEGSLLLKDASDAWGFENPSFSNGAAYADLDGDGDLDIVTNNVDSKATIYKNNTRESFADNHYLRIKFDGPPENPFGVGTKVTIARSDTNIMMREMYPVRGYQSSMEYALHFGLDSLETIPSVQIRWPDGKEETLQKVNTNQSLTVKYSNSKSVLDEPENSDSKSDSLFIEITDQVGIKYKHEENEFVEFNREPLIPHMVSTEGPAIAVADINGDGRDDFYAGGAKRQPAKLFIQAEAGKFEQKEIPAFQNDFIQEDVDAVFADFDNDGDQDLVVVSGGNEYYGNSEYMMPRLYRNDGSGNFSRDNNAMPNIYLTGSVAAVGDADGDNDLDLFIGARAVPWNYGEPPESYLLINEGGQFIRADSSVAKPFSDLGLVTDAQWADMNADGKQDLVVASEWALLQIVYSGSDEVYQVPNSSGLWKNITICDVDEDGKPDILAGNLGLNSKFKASPEKPLRMYFGDFDENGKKEQLVTYIDDEGKERIFATKDELAEQLDYINKRYETYQEYAEAALTDIIDEDKLENATQYEVTELRSSIFYNNGDSFEKKSLPITAQFSPIHAITELEKQNGESFLLTAGNFYDANIQRGRYDAGYGSVFKKAGTRKLEQLPNNEIHFYLGGQIRALRTISIDGQKVLLAAENNKPLRFFRLTK